MWSKFQGINPQIVKALQKQGFKEPTEIQSEVLEHYKHYYDFLLASQTGSGKTLAFGIPIMSDLLTLKSGPNPSPTHLSCLILTPTRQLALQISEHLNAINPNKTIKIMNIVGGLSKEKQQRLLSYKPDIVIATPGRLNELLGIEGLELTLSRLRYLVIDEADRMIELGHFREVDEILDRVFTIKHETFDKELKEAVEEKNPTTHLYVKDKRVNMSFLDSLETDKLVELPDDFLKIIDANDIGKKKKKKKNDKAAEKEKEKQRLAIKQADTLKKEKQKEQAKLAKGPQIKKRIFLVSATLTREFKDGKYYTKKSEPVVEKGRSRGGEVQVDSQLTPKLKALVSRIKFTSKPKIIDLSSILFLPQKLVQYVSYCEDQMDRISHLMVYLDSLPQNIKTLIFTNTIKASKMVSSLLTLLQYPNTILHSNMQQRQRLTKLQRFQTSEASTLICTDLAARGLDMKVDVVIQYGLPTNGDTYVHRLGRTARAGRSGQGLVLVAKKQYKRWKEILGVVTKGKEEYQPTIYQMELKKLDDARSKVEMAEKARVNNRRVEAEESRKWLQKEADRADIILDANRPSGQETPRKLIKKIWLPKPVDRQQQELARWSKKKIVLSPNEIEAYLKQQKK